MTYAALMSAPLLPREREVELALAWQRRKDRRALAELINAHARLAVQAAAKFARAGFSADDLVQEGLAGMIRALETFDVTKGFRFSTYATFWIKAAIQQYQWHNSSIVALPQSNKKKIAFRRLRYENADVLLPERAAALAREHGLDIGEIQAMHLRVNGRIASSLDTAWGETVPALEATPEENAIELSDAHARKRAIAQALATLSPREAKVIRLRWLGADKKTLEDLAGVMGVTKERIRQIETVAIRKMRPVLERAGYGA